MATKKTSNKSNDERKARARYVDQPGQWQDTTSASVKKKRAAGLKALSDSMKKAPTKRK